MQVTYGQVVVGPPGSGKTTYCNGMQQFLAALGRECAIINLDAANHGENLPYKPDVDIEELISLGDVMREFDLGPNGGLVYCLEYLEKNLDWLLQKLEPLRGKYLLFDFPGQVELFTHYTCVQSVVAALQKQEFRLAAVHLVDAIHCSSASRFVSVVLLSLMTMLRLELPHVSALSKVDLLSRAGADLPFNLDFFTDCSDLSRILQYLDAPPRGNASATEDGAGNDYEGDEDDEEEDREEGGAAAGGGGGGGGGSGPPAAASGVDVLAGRMRRMNAELCQVLDGYGLVSFQPLHIEDPVSVGRLLRQVDKANGYDLERAARTWQEEDASSGAGYANRLFQSAFAADTEPSFERVMAVQERFGGPEYRPPSPSPLLPTSPPPPPGNP